MSDKISKPVLSGKILAALSYISILCLIPFIVRTDNKFIMYHAKQGLALWIWQILAGVLIFIPVLGQVFFIVSLVLCMLFSLGGIFQAALGRCWKIPVIGNMVEGL